MLTLKYNYLTKRKHKISNLYMLPKLHKSKQIKEIIQKQQFEYINIMENIIVEAPPPPHSRWSRLPHQQHIRNTSCHYGTISSNDFTYS